MKNLVVKNFKNQLLKKIESIKEPPMNILKRFDGYLQKDKTNQANKKATGQSISCVMVKILRSSTLPPNAEEYQLENVVLADLDEDREEDHSRMDLLGHANKFKKQLTKQSAKRKDKRKQEQVTELAKKRQEPR